MMSYRMKYPFGLLSSDPGAIPSQILQPPWLEEQQMKLRNWSGTAQQHQKHQGVPALLFSWSQSIPAEPRMVPTPHSMLLTDSILTHTFQITVIIFPVAFFYIHTQISFPQTTGHPSKLAVVFIDSMPLASMCHSRHSGQVRWSVVLDCCVLDPAVVLWELL